MDQSAPPPAKTKLGRLRSFGIAEVHQAPLLLPKAYEDLRQVERNFEWLIEGDRVLVAGALDGGLHVSHKDGTPRMSSSLSDGKGHWVGFTFFGDTRPLQEEIRSRAADVALLGTVKRVGNKLWLSNPDLVPAAWIGRIRAVYPGIPRVINPDTVRDRMMEVLGAGVPAAAQWLWALLGESPRASRVGIKLLDEWLGGLLDPAQQVEVLLRSAHLPSDVDEGELAQERLEQLAALALWARMEAGTARATPSRWTQIAPIEERIAALPFSLSESQASAVEAARQDIVSGRPCRRLVSGDVGSGKSCVLGLVTMSVADAGGRVALIAPSQPLAEQLYGEFVAWWPDLAFQSSLVVGGKKSDASHSRLVVGTTALLHGDFGEFDLIVCDEQHKFSVAQREQLVRPGCHLLEATATCIPRTQALAKYGALNVSLLKAHVAKDIQTRIRYVGDRHALWEDIKATVADGHQVLVIYPTRNEEAEKDDLPSAEAAAKKWDKAMPGKIGLAHAGRTGSENEDALRRMYSGELDILVSTVLVEVGINLPKLRRVVVFHAERFGLTQLHQIRGRAARTGGRGWFDLVLPRTVRDDTLKRLQVLERITDGFEVAQEDLKLRGFGDLSAASERQSGSDGSVLFGRGVRVDLMDRALALVDTS